MIGLKKSESLTLSLREIYESYGYKRYRMGNFEEYDFYLANKAFLKSDRIITFSDMDGNLMALKPDVTLSIVKNAKAGDKFYYMENVYRPGKYGVSFKEIEQVGLEAIGTADIVAECEVLFLAAESLKSIDENYVLDVSHMGIINALCENFPDKSLVMELLASKNKHEAKQKLGDNDFLSAVMNDDLNALSKIPQIAGYISEIKEIFAYLDEKKVKYNLDFSLVNDGNYYNGVIFRGFTERVPEPVLSGGRYDNLLKNLKKDCSGLGFAVYLDGLDVYDAKREYDCDIALIHGEKADGVLDYAEKLRREGYSVRVLSEPNDDLRCKKVIYYDKTENKNA